MSLVWVERICGFLVDYKINSGNNSSFGYICSVILVDVAEMFRRCYIDVILKGVAEFAMTRKCSKAAKAKSNNMPNKIAHTLYANTLLTPLQLALLFNLALCWSDRVCQV